MQKTNVLVAIKNIFEAKARIVSSQDGQISTNRINSVGEGLETFVKNAFCSSLNDAKADKDKKYSQYLSYKGNKNSPPDAVIREGDVIEIKKLEGYSDIALNSSHPKNKVYSTDTKIAKGCQTCEVWSQKDMLYVIGTVPKESPLKSIWFVYGDCYAANKDVYERALEKVSDGISQVENLDFSDSNELARVNKVDLLEITYLRVRGMWHIQHPAKVFDRLVQNKKTQFSLHALMLKEKYDSFPKNDRDWIENNKHEGFKLSEVKIKSPNNPCEDLIAIHILYEVK